jgi:hypothetical protein
LGVYFGSKSKVVVFSIALENLFCAYCLCFIVLRIIIHNSAELWTGARRLPCRYDVTQI